MCIYVCLHVETETYLRGNHLLSPASIKHRCQIKVNQRLLGFPRDWLSANVFMSSRWMARSPEMRMFNLGYIQVE